MSNPTPSVPKLPAPLDKYWTSHRAVREAHKALADMTLQQAHEAIQAPRRTACSVTYHELAPQRDHDPENAIVLTIPFANPYRLDMALRGWLLQQSLRIPQRLILFPQNTLGKPVYPLSAAERKLVRRGDFGPIAKQQAQVLQHLGIRRCSITGYSLGAAIGARLFRELTLSGITVHRLGLFEAPNVLPRNRLQMIRAFAKGGRTALRQAVRDAGIPALDALKNADSAGAKVKDLLHFMLFTLSSLLPANRAIMSGAACPTFIDDLLAAYAALAEQNKPLPKVVIGAAEKSDITPTHILDMHARALKEAAIPVDSILIHDYGHELGDNLAAHTVLMHTALA